MNLSHEISINVNKLAVLLLPVYLFTCLSVFLLYCTLLLLVYFFIPFLYCIVVAIFLFIRWLCKQIHYFCLFGAFVYHFKVTISIFVTICCAIARHSLKLLCGHCAQYLKFSCDFLSYFLYSLLPKCCLWVRFVYIFKIFLNITRLVSVFHLMCNQRIKCLNGTHCNGYEVTRR